MTLRGLLAATKRTHLLVGTVLLVGTALGSMSTWIYQRGEEEGATRAEQRITNQLLEQILHRLTALEAARSENERLVHSLLAGLETATNEMDSIGDEVNRHVQEDIQATWRLWHRLDALDHLGVPQTPPLQSGRRQRK